LLGSDDHSTIIVIAPEGGTTDAGPSSDDRVPADATGDDQPATADPCPGAVHFKFAGDWDLWDSAGTRSRSMEGSTANYIPMTDGAGTHVRLEVIDGRATLHYQVFSNTADWQATKSVELKALLRVESLPSLTSIMSLLTLHPDGGRISEATVAHDTNSLASFYARDGGEDWQNVFTLTDQYDTSWINVSFKIERTGPSGSAHLTLATETGSQSSDRPAFTDTEFAAENGEGNIGTVANFGIVGPILGEGAMNIARVEVITCPQ
jgi:hypothetical protein